MGYFEIIVAFVTVFTFEIDAVFIIFLVIVLVGLLVVISFSIFEYYGRSKDLRDEKEKVKSQPGTPKSISKD